MSKVPCQQCGTLITEITAKVNNGICMLCKNNAVVCSRCGRRTLMPLPHHMGNICPKCMGAIEAQTRKHAKFDRKRLLEASIKAINQFAAKHTAETFYAFAIDAGMLCLNSNEEFEKTLHKYKKKYPEHYSNPHNIHELRMNTGDWAYQGFFDLEEAHGFCPSLYSDHYHIGPLSMGRLRQKFTRYYRAMRRLIRDIKKSRVLEKLKRTKDFVVFLAEHEY